MGQLLVCVRLLSAFPICPCPAPSQLDEGLGLRPTAQVRSLEAHIGRTEPGMSEVPSQNTCKFHLTLRVCC